MIQLSTRQKIACAKILNRGLRVLRGIAGRPMQGVFTKRDGLRWALDLNEGIDLAIWLRGEFEPELGSYYRRTLHDGSVVLDIGANIGAHTLPLAHAVGPAGRVIAIEATEYAHEKLRRNLELNPDLVPRVCLIHSILVSDPAKPVETAIASSWPLHDKEDVHPTLGGALRSVGRAQARTVDQVVTETRLSRIDLIKLDVDGHELSVIQGAHDTLKRFTPPLLMEFAPYCHEGREHDFTTLINELLAYGYRFQDPQSGRELPCHVPDLLGYIPANGSINVLVARPAA